MTSTRPLISIVIPTRERVETLRATLSTALAQKSDRIEILVADNASSDGTQAFVESISDPRLRYVNSGGRVSMSANWEIALAHATGEYFLIIGDDDAVLPGAIDRFITDIDGKTEVYIWPKHIYVWPAAGRNAYVERLALQTAPQWADLVRLSRFVIRMGGWRHYLLPSIYHSVVARRIPDEIRRRTGRVYHSVLPDVFMAMCIPALATTARDVGYTVTAHGRSQNSNGWVATISTESAALRRFVEEYGHYRLHPTLYPGIPITANLVPDAILVARDLFPDSYASAQFGYEAMWAYICRDAATFKWDVKPWDVVRDRLRIREYHPLRLGRFAAYLAMQEAAGIRSRLVNRVAAPTAPADIGGFVQGLVARGPTAS